MGGHVTNTVRKGIVSTEVFQASPEIFVLGMLSALLAAGVWLNLATFLGLPVSTTHSIIGAIVGFGLLVGGASAIHWGKLLSVVMSWVVSPLCGGLVGWITFTFIKRTVLTSWNPVRAARRVVPLLIFPVAVILVLSMLYKAEGCPEEKGGRLRSGGKDLRLSANRDRVLRSIRPWGQRCSQRHRAFRGHRVRI